MLASCLPVRDQTVVWSLTLLCRGGLFDRFEEFPTDGAEAARVVRGYAAAGAALRPTPTMGRAQTRESVRGTVSLLI